MSESAKIVVVILAVIVGRGEWLASDFDEAVEDVVDGAAVHVEGGNGHEGGSEQRRHGEVKQWRERCGR